jgi:SH3-like domain-containing protein
LKSDSVNGREGPSKDHPILWRYQLRGLPVEVIEEDLDWRKVRDPDGAEVWVNAGLLESRRMGIVKGGMAQLRRRPSLDAPVSAEAEPGVLFEIKDCRNGWMRVDGARAAGWLPQGELWGAGCG